VQTREATLLAYNDVFYVIAVLASVHAAWVFGRAIWLNYFVPPAPAPAAPAPAAPQAPADQITD
jgi:hypothetical protein